MRENLAIKFLAEHNHILELIRNGVLLRIATVPNLGFTEEAESRALDHLGRSAEGIRAKEDGRSKDSFEGDLLADALVHLQQLAVEMSEFLECFFKQPSEMLGVESFKRECKF